MYYIYNNVHFGLLFQDNWDDEDDGEKDNESENGIL